MLCVGSIHDKILLKNSYLEVTICAEKQLLTADWSGVLDSGKGHEGCEEILSFVRTYPVKKILNNNSKVTGHSGNSDWLGVVWLPGLSDAGVMRFAWVYSPSLFTQLSIDKAISLYNDMEIRTFFSVQEALDWLEMN